MGQLRKDVQAGLDQIAPGEYVQYDRKSTPKLAARVKARGKKSLAQLKASKRASSR